jgi:aminoglycoside 6'-N-acetyltransferase
MGEPLVLHGERVVLRPAVDADAARLAEILATQEVATWWGAYPLERVREEMTDGPYEDELTFVVEVDGVVIGLIQQWEEHEPQYRHAGIDISLHPDWHGKGLGTDAVRTLARHMFEDLGHHRVTIDPAAHNERAIASYRKVGFKPVGIMRNYERAPDGTWHDGLLMDLLPEDLT